MAKNDRNRNDNIGSESTPVSVVSGTDVPASDAAAPAQAATTETKASTDNRAKMLKHPDTGEQVKRQDYIRELARNGLSRSEITKKIREVTGDPNFRYQIVFQATKGMPNLKASDRGKKPEAAASAAAPATEATPATEAPAQG